MTMPRFRTNVTAVLFLMFGAALARSQSFTTQRFDIGASGFFDYLSVDTATGRVFVSRGTHIQVVDGATGRVLGDIPNTPRTHGALIVDATNRIFVGCSDTSVVVDATNGKVVARIAAGGGVDGMAFDATEKLLYIPSGASGTVTVVHEDSPDKYTIVATVPTMRGARTIAVNEKTHTAFVFTPEFGPAPAGAEPTPGPGGRGQPPRGPQVAAWLFAIKH